MKLFLNIFLISIFVFLIHNSSFIIHNSFAVYDPTSVPNNKFGIHIIQATKDELDPARELVNTNGDWGYITVLIESKDRDENKWQNFFNELRRKHLIPLVRLATKPHPSGYWERPYEKEEEAWAGFLNKLNWPTKNRYVIIFNEPNHATEWGNTAEPADYARTLDRFITALKKESEDFFILNAGFDASTPQKPPVYIEQSQYMREMEAVVPGIFNRLDGWNSHSYPNPGFRGSPQDSGKGSIRTYEWEINFLRSLGITEQSSSTKKNLPIFITETGWKQAEGVHAGEAHIDRSFPPAQTVATYYKYAFENVWNRNEIVAVSPFILTYLDPPFDHFSFKKSGTNSSSNTEENFYPQYKVIKDLPKTSGAPKQEQKAELVKGEIFRSIVKNQDYSITISFKNIGQSIWGDEEDESLKLVAFEGGKELGIEPVSIPKGTKVEPGNEHTFNLKLHAPESGTYNVKLNLFNGQTQFDSEPIDFTTEVKAPVIIKVKSNLKWKKDFEGNYLLSIAGAIGEKLTNVILDSKGASEEFEVKYLLPDYSFKFTLEKPFYKPKTIRQEVHSGVNELDFGELQPDLGSAILKPKVFWQLLPFSN